MQVDGAQARSAIHDDESRDGRDRVSERLVLLMHAVHRGCLANAEIHRGEGEGSHDVEHR